MSASYYAAVLTECVPIKAIAHELNERGIPAPRGGKWHLTMVTRLLHRLEKLDRASNSRHRR
jgi:hypothetical protein